MHRAPLAGGARKALAILSLIESFQEKFTANSNY